MSDAYTKQPNSRFPANALGFLILLNVVIYALQINGFLLEMRIYGHSIQQMQFGSLAGEDLALRGEWWRLFTYMFVHDIAWPFHIGLNMLMVFFCGWIVQQRVGEAMLLLIYVAGGLFGGLLQVMVHPQPLVGASAAGYALLASVGVIMANQRVTARPGLILRFRIRVKNCVLGIMIVTVITFIIDLIAGPNANIPMISNVGHVAHLGGALAGYLICRLMKVGHGVSLESLQAQRRAREGSPDVLGEFDPGGILSSPTPNSSALTMTDLDPILDKISRDGFLSLTDEERDTLQQGFQLMSRT